jgi:hypothetical protein
MENASLQDIAIDISFSAERAKTVLELLLNHWDNLRSYSTRFIETDLPIATIIAAIHAALDEIKSIENLANKLESGQELEKISQVYTIRGDAAFDEIYDALTERLSQINALICVIGNEERDIEKWNTELRRNYTLTLRRRVEECKELLDELHKKEKKPEISAD